MIPISTVQKRIDPIINYYHLLPFPDLGLKNLTTTLASPVQAMNHKLLHPVSMIMWTIIWVKNLIWKMVEDPWREWLPIIIIEVDVHLASYLKLLFHLFHQKGEYYNYASCLFNFFFLVKCIEFI